MYHYNFTNDLRISNLDNTLKEAATAFLTDTVPSATIDKSKNNNFMTVGFYFNLKAKGNCAKLAADGNIKKVVLNFIKKFQFPNVRTTSDYENAISDNIRLAPMREIVKFLNALSLIDRTEAYLTKDEIQNFIFFNNSVAKSKNPNIIEASLQIIKYRKDKILPQNIDVNESEHFWNQPDRQIREMIKTLKYTGCFSDVDENTIKFDVRNISRDSKADLFEIINFDSYWTGETVEEWQKYMDDGLDIKTNTNFCTENSPLSPLNSPFSPTQTIFYGVPGSGKSHKIDEETKDLPDEQKMRVVFHPEYTNAEQRGRNDFLQVQAGTVHKNTSQGVSESIKKILPHHRRNQPRECRRDFRRRVSAFGQDNRRQGRSKRRIFLRKRLEPLFNRKRVHELVHPKKSLCGHKPQVAERG